MVRAVDSHSAVTKVCVFYFDFLSWFQWVVIGCCGLLQFDCLGEILLD